MKNVMLDVHVYLWVLDSFLHLHNLDVYKRQPETFSGTVTPFQAAAGSHQSLEDLGIMSGMQDNQTHAAQDVIDVYKRQVSKPSSRRSSGRIRIPC